MKLRFATVVLSALVVLALPAAAQAAPVCAKYANATTGSDTLGSGTAGSPYATISKVLSTINSGEAGCLTGTFSGPVDIITPGRTLMSASQAQPATVAGYVYIHDNGGGTTLMGLHLDQTTVNDRPGLRIENDGVSLIGNEIFNDTLPCVFVGPTALLAADTTRIEGNRLHNCGTYAIQIDHGSGNVVTDNYFFDNTGNVIDLFETSTGTQVRNNVIDDGSVGVKFAGVTSGATVTQNVITNQVDSTIAADPATTGTGNTVAGNCVSEVVPDSPDYEGETDNLVSVSPYGTDFTITATDCFGKGPNPLAATTPATSVTRSTATLNGDLNPHWHSATFFFEWGTDPTLATKSTTTSSNATNWVPVPVSGTLDGLKGGTTYYFRLVATNSSGGRSEGAIESFTTQPPLDRDGDGVPDDTDKCPDAPRGSVDANGDG